MIDAELFKKADCEDDSCPPTVSELPIDRDDPNRDTPATDREPAFASARADREPDTYAVPKPLKEPAVIIDDLTERFPLTTPEEAAEKAPPVKSECLTERLLEI